MKDNQKRYWKGLEQLTNNTDFVKKNEKEFPEYLPINSNRANGSDAGPSRRDFLKMMGFGIAAASLAACEAPVRYAIPYLNKPVDVDPSIPNYYASTFAQGGDYCSIVVKTREGRPIKIEGNQYSTITQGGVMAQVEASVLSLYDSARLADPIKKGGEKIDWAKLDTEVTEGLRGARNVKVVSNTLLSPSTNAAISDFLARFNGEHIVYDPYSSYALIEAHQQNFNVRAIPSYDFSKASVIVSFGADFLGTWISPVEFNKQYSKTRKLSAKKKVMSRHYQFESVMTITGANADYRTPIKPSEEGMAVMALYNLLAGKAGGASSGLNTNKQEKEFKYLEKAANDLLRHKGTGLVISSSNDVYVQKVVNAINQLLGNYGTTINIDKPAFYRQGNDVQMARFVEDAKAGRVDAVIFYDCNPVYDFAGGSDLGAALAGGKVKMKVAIQDRLNETSVLCDYVAADHHYLESWNDFEPKRNHFSLAQPTIRPIFNTRQGQESLLTWAGSAEKDYYKYLRNRWKNNQFAGQTQDQDFDKFWDTALFTGVYIPGVKYDLVVPPGGPDEKVEGGPSIAITGTEVVGAGVGATFTNDVVADARAVAGKYKANPENIELVLYQKVGIGVGRQANNPWLQELPDPITKITWDNYLTIPQSMAKDFNLDNLTNNQETRKANLTVNGVTISVPVVVQPGQAKGTVGLALGYGRTNAGKVADNLGVNAFPFVKLENGVCQYYVAEGVSVEPTGEAYSIAHTQTHETYMGRETIIQEATLEEYQKDPLAGRYQPMIATSKGPMDPEKISLWDGHVFPNHHWAMAIDLNSCTGCGACVVACISENNIPTVGKAEVLNRREMHWLRIDRYYSSPENAESYKEMEVAAENPEVVFQPMLCQQCNNAPCETVCPVIATAHSTEGLNMMNYARCIGTRYCANNCPYKVRRFNWFKYHDNSEFDAVNFQMNDDLGKMVLNPDVTVRARGVMEKCTFCVQRIQSGKLTAKRENRRPLDGEIVTACASACPTDAIIFGDLNDPESQIRELLMEEEQGRAYNVLKEIGTRPNVYYLTKIRNRDQEETNA